MKIRVVLFTVIVAFGCVPTDGQDRRDIESKYGKRADVYSVNERLWMTPSYDRDGQVCLMRVYPKTVSRNVNYPGADLDINEVLKFTNELFPVNTRGRRDSGFGLSDLGGGIVWTRFNYEHVHFVFISTFTLTKKADGTIDMGDPVDLDWPIDEAAVEEYKRKEEKKSDDELIREHAFNSKILEIYWPERKCDEH